jgi:gliding motility-associated-like protein
MIKRFAQFFLATLFTLSSFKSFSQIVATPSAGCAPLVGVNFLGISGASSILWTFGDAASANTNNPTHTYVSPGNYVVTYTAIVSSAPVTHTMLVKVYGKPTPNFSYTLPVSHCAPMTVPFTDLSVGSGTTPITQWQWAYGDGGIGNTQNPTYVYTIPGTFNVTLIAKDANGCDSTITKTAIIKVSAQPTVIINSNPLSLSSCTVPFTVNFSGTNCASGSPSGGPLTYNWGFGNSQTSTSVTPPPVTYTANGAYTVSLTCTDNNQCSKTVSTTVNLLTPHVKVKIRDTVCYGAYVIERDSSNAGFTTWAWGDATPNVTNIPTDTVMHHFTVPGVQTITVTANSGGCLDVKTFTVYVEKVVASFTSTPLAFSCNQPFPASYVNTTNTTVGSPFTWNWSFFPTNGPPPSIATSNVMNPTFTLTQGSNNPYTIFTMYKPTVQLIAISKYGCRDSITHVYDSIKRITSYFYTDKSEGCAPLTVTFTDTSFSTAPLNNYGWDFGDGSPLLTGPTQSIVVHTYTSVGTYSVVHTVTNTAGCTDISFIKWIYVRNPPVPSFSFSPSSVCWSDSVQIINTTTVTPGDTVNHWHVTSDDGYFSGCVNNPTPYWHFNHTGVFGFTMTAYVHGCAGSTPSTSSVTVKGPIARGRYFTRCDSSYKVQFTANLQDCQSATWNYGDGSLQTLTGTGSFTTTHTYTASGNYTAYLTGYNPSTGCRPFTDTIIVTVRKIIAAFAGPPVACSKIPAAFSAFNSKDVMKGCGIGFTWYIGTFPPRVTALDTINYAITTPGTYSVMLVVRDTNNCMDTARSMISISSVTANFAITSSSVGCLPSYVLTTTNTSVSDAPLTYTWNYGDPGSGAANTSTVINGTHTYTSASSPGQTFTITVVATNSNGCVSTATQAITVNAPLPVISPSSSNSVCVNSVINFNAANVPGAVNYVWNFNDGSPTQTVTTISLPHTYTNGGVYSVSLTTTDASGCKGKGTFTVYVQNYPVPGFSYVNQCNSTSSVACAGCAVIFQDTSINPIPGPRNWNLSSGGPVVGTATVGNTYTSPGQYPITLTVTTSFGCAVTVSHTLTVLGAAADYFTDKNTICKNSPILFTIKDTTNVMTWSWDFGDGRDTGNVSPISHYYSFYPPGGTTNASLTYWTSDSACKYSVVYPINIRDVVAAFNRNLELTIQDWRHCIGNTDQFTDQSTGTPTYWFWNFGDGATSSSVSPSHTYTNTGTYTVALAIEDTQYHCKDTIRKTMEILALPSITVVPQPTCALSPSQFTTTGLSSYSYTWSPSTNLNNANVANPIATLTTSTIFTIQVKDIDGCVSVLTQSVYIQEPPKPISWDTAIVIGQQINIPGYAGSGFNYFWNPTSYLSCTTCPYPLFTGTVSMTYTALTMDTMGCFSINNTFTIEVLPKSSVDVPTAFTPNGDGINDVIYVDGWGIKKLNFFRIYNRWGQLLFESNDIKVGWDGTYMGVPQNMETYVWQVSVETYIDEKPLFKTSTFKLLR